MSTFQVPYSSSPPAPSTPNSSAKRTGNFGSTNFLPTNPSTTPAGPPPSSVGSFTPADPPPSMLGSSQLGAGKTLFKAKSSYKTTPRSRKNGTSATKSDKLAKQLSHSSRFDISNSKPKSTGSIFGLQSNSSAPDFERTFLSHEEEDEVQDASQEEDEEVDYDEAFRADAYGRKTSRDNGTGLFSSQGRFVTKALDTSSSYRHAQGLDSSLFVASSRGVKRSRGGSTILADSSIAKRATKPRKYSAIPSIALDMATQMKVAPLTEENNFILASEDILATMYAAENDGQNINKNTKSALTTASYQLCNLWIGYRDRDERFSKKNEDVTFSVGPKPEELSVHKATFIGSLLLQLHHPENARGKQALALTRFGKSFSSKSANTEGPSLNPTAIPKILLDWLDKHHNPWRPSIIEVESRHPSPAAHYNFWDVMFVLILRGKVQDAVRILRESDFHCAETAPKDGQRDGYTDLQVSNIQLVVNKAVEVLRTCPAVTEEDWNITGNSWTLFRKLVGQAITDLTKFAEGRDEDSDLDEPALHSSRARLNSAILTHSQISRRAESRVPWTIYQNLKTMYGILLGGDSEVIALAQDWVEATIGLTVWWTGDSEDIISVGSLAKTRRSLIRSQAGRQRLVDVDSEAAYLDRLTRSFERATDDSDDDEFQINSNNPVEVGLASVFEGNIEGVMGFLRAWSLPVASAVAEIATLGGWFSSSPARPDAIMDGFDENDLMVLSSYGQPERLIRRDTIMIEYAGALFDRGIMRKEGEAEQDGLEGWQLSIALLVRLGDDAMSRREIGKLLRRLHVESDERANMLLSICRDYGMEEDGRRIAEKYADSAKDNPNSYGTALTYYARAHCKKKLQDMLNLFVSLSLLGSTAVPPLTSLDPNFHSLIADPQPALAPLVEADREAAVMLHTNLAGYASLRRFYDLRDEEVNLKEGQKPSMQPKERTTTIVTALLAVVNSAADTISGGLYEESREAVVPVEGLTVLLGEAMMFVNQSASALSLPQCVALVKVVEDLQGVSRWVYDRCENFLRSSLASYHSNESPASPPQLLQNTSSMTSGSSFSLVGGSMLNSQTSDGMKDHSLVKSQDMVKRGWDWRGGMARNAKGEDVLRVLRLGLAKDIAKHWIEDDGA